MCQATSEQQPLAELDKNTTAGEAIKYSADKTVDVILAEFSALRAEINSRAARQQQITYWLLVITGTLITLAMNQQEILLLLMCPVLTLFLAIRYADHGAQIARIGDYIERRIEHRLKELGWESWLSSGDARPSFGRSGWAAGVAWRGVFVTMQVLPTAVAILRFWPQLSFASSTAIASLVLYWVLLFLNGVIPVCTWLVLKHRRFDD